MYNLKDATATGKAEDAGYTRVGTRAFKVEPGPCPPPPSGNAYQQTKGVWYMTAVPNAKGEVFGGLDQQATNQLIIIATFALILFSLGTVTVEFLR